MSQFYRRMGSKVTVVDSNPRLLPHEEPEAADMLQPIFEAEGINVRAGRKSDRRRCDGRRAAFA